MAEFSLFWPTGTTGDGTNPYTSDQVWAWLRRTANSDGYTLSGPLKTYAQELAVSVFQDMITGKWKARVSPGAAYVYGIPYENDGTVDFPIGLPGNGSRIDRVILRADWSARTVRLAVLTGEVGGGVPPLYQTAGDRWEIPLAYFTVTPTGIDPNSLVDERSFCRFATEIVDEQIAADAAIQQSKIDNTTRAIDADMVDGKHADSTPNNLPVLDENGKIPSSLLPNNIRRLEFMISTWRDKGTNGSWANMHPQGFYYEADRFPENIAEVRLYITYGAFGGTTNIQVRLIDALNDNQVLWTSAPTTAQEIAEVIPITDLQSPANLFIQGNSPTGQTVRLYEAKLVLLWDAP